MSKAAELMRRVCRKVFSAPPQPHFFTRHALAKTLRTDVGCKKIARRAPNAWLTTADGKFSPLFELRDEDLKG
jgi:hypothetical protein